ncbi:MAG TPA: sulfurtransferase [Actinomycetota bacterium]|nr:sulfurtransferase [Actinomycetota bacterium]
MRQTAGYARPELLAEPDWLWDRQEDPTVRLIDCGSAEGYERAHIPEAVSLGVHPWIKESEGSLHVMGAEDFAQLIGGLGVANDTTVVAYDDFNTSFAARLWWVLKYYGHDQAKVLNGGWHRWLTEARPVTFHPTEPERTQFTAKPNEAVIARLDDVRTRVGDPQVQILNALPAKLFTGESNPFGNKRVGHIPGSVNVPIEEFFTDDDRRLFKPAEELEAILEKAGVPRDREVIVHCQAGVRTTLGFFVLALLGWDRIRAYDAALAEWGNLDDTPLVTGPD